MEAVTLSDTKVQQLVQEKFSPLKLDVSKNKEDINALKSDTGLEVGKLPVVFVINTDGSLVKKITGYVSPEKFLEEMQNLAGVAEEKDTTVEKKEVGNVWLSSLNEGKNEAKSKQKTLLVKVGATW